MPSTDNNLESMIQVCDKCLCASCWQSIFMCDEYFDAGTVYKTVAELRELNLEHSDYWKTDEQLAEGSV